jgi:hypothetical protein
MIHDSFSEERMRRHRIVSVAAAGVLGLIGLWPAAHADSKGQPALWRTYDMIVNFQKLPRTYTCDQLWYEFHGILLQLGAWPYSVSILPYHCSPSPTGYMRSPDVEARFQLPIFLHGVAARSAPAQAVERTVRLAPGKPKILQTSDCQLLKQITQTMLASIEATVGETHFDCAGPPNRAARFGVSVTLPMVLKMPPAPTTAGSGPRSP